MSHAASPVPFEPNFDPSSTADFGPGALSAALPVARPTTSSPPPSRSVPGVDAPFGPATASGAVPALSPSWAGTGVPETRVVPGPTSARYPRLGFGVAGSWALGAIVLGLDGLVGGAGLFLAWRALEAWGRPGSSGRSSRAQDLPGQSSVH